MDFYSLKQLSEKSGVSMPTLRRWCVDGKLTGAFITAGAWFVPKNVKLPKIQSSGKRAPAYGTKKTQTA